MSTVERSESPPGRARRRRMSVDQYERLIADGVIDADAPVELIEGRIVGKMTKGDAHCTAADLVQVALMATLAGAGWLVRIEKPVAIPSKKSMPEPDFSIVRGGPRDYEDGQPRPDRVGLVVEIADTSLRRDRRRARTFVAGGIPECWVLNLVQGRLEVFRPGSADPEIIGAEGSVELVLDGKFVARIAVADLLPRRKATDTPR
ncbi:Uma2 family endonuclease [Aquisphaera insulae]|uniref:Uma2 family endonuclease n=1 Tax=Aquisphaera insulae TaxID=2712864 RepID=UPI0013ED0F74|nr:Uma2 family endonuclease [Aquisphaera insulae]